MKTRALVLALVVFAGMAKAQTPAPQQPTAPLPPVTSSTTPESQQKPVAAFADDKPDCLEWTDSCIVCKRQPDGSAACSTVGMACLPAAPSCTKTKSTP